MDVNTVVMALVGAVIVLGKVVEHLMGRKKDAIFAELVKKLDTVLEAFTDLKHKDEIAAVQEEAWKKQLDRDVSDISSTVTATRVLLQGQDKLYDRMGELTDEFKRARQQSDGGH